MKLTYGYSLVIALITAMSFPLSPASADDAMQQRVESQMRVPDRHEFDLPRDASRKPYEVFQFLGVQEGMTALDVGAYAGYTTEMLSAAVGPSGHVFSQNTMNVYLNYADGYYERTMDERLGGGRLPNVTMHIAEYEALGLAGRVDVAFLGNMLHDFYYRDGRDRAVLFLKTIAITLKPGGVLGVMDHVGIAEQDNAALHRIEPRLVRELLVEAGFNVEAESKLFRNADDPHTDMVYSDTIYRRTDRILFRAVPAADRPQ
jgi:predicted methyltransferase